MVFLDQTSVLFCRGQGERLTRGILCVLPLKIGARQGLDQGASTGDVKSCGFIWVRGATCNFRLCFPYRMPLRDAGRGFCWNGTGVRARMYGEMRVNNQWVARLGLPWMPGDLILKSNVLIALATVCFGLGVLADPRAGLGAPSGKSTIVSAIRERGFVLCGVRDNVLGFSVIDASGRWSGLDVDFCAALAVAVLGSKDAVQYRPLSNGQRFGALSAGEIDVLSGGASWTLSRDTELGVRFVGTLFHDGQVFLVRRDQAVTSALELTGTSVCVLEGTRAAQNVARYFGSRQMRYKLVSKKRWEDVISTYQDGDCNVLTGDMSLIAAARMRLPSPGGHQILREVVSKEPLGPAVAGGDEVWFSIVRWTLNALLEAEELGITSENIGEFSSSKLPRERRLMGLDGDLGRSMGLARDWAHQVVLQVGNYSQLFERNVGSGSPLKLSRGINGLWNKGGLMYGAPLR